jgi:hypothetical protein
MRTGPFTQRVHATPFKRACSFILLVISVAITTVLAAGCGDGGGGGNATFVQNGSTWQVFQTYEGVASTTVQFTDALGQTHIRNYLIPVAIEVCPSLQTQATTQTERNPFHFSVKPAFLGAIAEEGLYTIVSAAIIFQGAESLVQYWRFVGSGTSFTGELTLPHTQSHNPLSPTVNQINLPPAPRGGFPIPVAFPLTQGTRLAGTMTTDHLRFRVEGNTTDRTHPFVSEVTATRIPMAPSSQ